MAKAFLLGLFLGLLIMGSVVGWNTPILTLKSPVTVCSCERPKVSVACEMDRTATVTLKDIVICASAHDDR